MSGDLKLAFVIEAVDNATKKLRAVNAAIEKSQEPMRKLRASTRDLLREAGWDRMRAGWDTVRNSAGSLLGTVTRVAQAVGVVGLAAGGMFAIFKRSADEVDRINDAAQQLGMSTQRFQGLGFAAQMNGSSADEMSQALTFLAQNMDEARNGSKEALVWFNRAGISLAELRNPSFRAADALERLSDKYTQVGNSGQNADKKIAMSKALMGRAGARMNQLLNQGSPAIRQFAADAQRLGVTLSKDTVKSMTAFNDEFDRARLTVFGNLANAFGKIAPKMSELTERFTNYVVANKELIATGVQEFFEALLKALPSIIAGVGALGLGIVALAKWADGVAKALGGWENAMQLVAGFIGAVLVVKTVLLGAAIFSLGLKVMAFTAIFAPMAAGFAAVTWPVGAVLALVAAMGLLIARSETLKSIGRGLGRGLFDSINPDVNDQENAALRGRVAARSALQAGAAGRSELGGTLKIELDDKGRWQVKDLKKKPGSVLDFDVGVYTGQTMGVN